jgi:hypothetical protein
MALNNHMLGGQELGGLAVSLPVFRPSAIGCFLQTRAAHKFDSPPERSLVESAPISIKYSQCLRRRMA